jgi:hypothetical protein
MKTKSFGSYSPGDADMPAYSDENLVLEALDDSHVAFGQLVSTTTMVSGFYESS